MPDELLDVVDDADRVIGKEMRAAVHLRGLQHRGRQRDNCPLVLDCSVSEHVKA